MDNTKNRPAQDKASGTARLGMSVRESKVRVGHSSGDTGAKDGNRNKRS